MSDRRVDVYALTEGEINDLREEDWTAETDSAKFDTPAAFKLYQWARDGGQDAECGDSVGWSRWHGRFDDVYGTGEPGAVGAILTETAQGFVTAELVPADEMEAAWNALEEAWERASREIEEGE